MNYATLSGPNGYPLAYIWTPATAAGAHLPTIIFLPGFRSDMNGTKALYLEEQAKARGQAFLRFDYGGHGVSGGAFKDGTIGSWMADAAAFIDKLIEGKVLLVGSSMGGWIALLLARARHDRVTGMVGIAAAPDFTRRLYDEEFDDAQRAALARDGYVDLPNAYDTRPYRFTRALIEDGAAHCLLDKNLSFPCPVRLVQGMRDDDVPWPTAHLIKKAAADSDITVTLVEGGDHRLSTPTDLALIDAQIIALNAV